MPHVASRTLEEIFRRRQRASVSIRVAGPLTGTREVLGRRQAGEFAELAVEMRLVGVAVQIRDSRPSRRALAPNTRPSTRLKRCNRRYSFGVTPTSSTNTSMKRRRLKPDLGRDRADARHVGRADEIARAPARPQDAACNGRHMRRSSASEQHAEFRLDGRRLDQPVVQASRASAPDVLERDVFVTQHAR